MTDKNMGGRPRTPGLTTRQLEVLRLSADGFTIPEIAARLDIAELTVERHQADARDRLGARNTTQAVHLAHLAQILSPPEPITTDERTLDATLRLVADDEYAVYLDDNWVYRSTKDKRVDRTRAVYDLETLGRVILERGEVLLSDIGRRRLTAIGAPGKSVTAANRDLITDLYVRRDHGPAMIAAAIGCRSELIRSAVKRWGLVEAREQHRRHRQIPSITTESRTPATERIAA